MCAAFEIAFRAGSRRTATSPIAIPTADTSAPAAHPSANTDVVAGPITKLAKPLPGSGIPNVRAAMHSASTRRLTVHGKGRT